MSSKVGKWTIVFNGCIYNYLELKQELQSLGHEFVTGTDTEVIAEGLSAFGTKFFERFNGMFAIGAWNHDDESLYLSRDRYGIKPLGVDIHGLRWHQRDPDQPATFGAR